MVILDWLPAFLGDYIVNSWTHVIHFKIVFRAVLESLGTSIQNILPAWLWHLIYGHFLNFNYHLNVIRIIIRRLFGRIWLVIRSLWSTDAFTELLGLQLEYLEAKHSQRSFYEFDMLEKFENGMNYILAWASRICLREVEHVPDLYAHVCDVVEFAQILCVFWGSGIRYVQAKRMNKMTAVWIRIVSMMSEDRAGVFAHRES